MRFGEDTILQKMKRRFFEFCTLYSSQKTVQKTVECDAHGIVRANISLHTLHTLQHLQAAHYDAYLVGGSVRDLLLQRKPKDFDIATNATPEQVRKVFRNSRMIGRRFRLVHVYYKGEIIEVSTFRANTEETTDFIASNNTYGTIEEDAWRRDFTINALYYNVSNANLIDLTGGLADLASRHIRIIGDPTQRFHEDPARLLRAIRLAAKLNFTLHDNTKQAVLELGHLLQHVAPARLSDEVIKLFFEGNALITFHFLEAMHYTPILFPGVHKIMQKDKSGQVTKLLHIALTGTDTRFHEKKRLTPSYLFGVFLWPVVSHRLKKTLEKPGEKKQHFSNILKMVIDQTIHEQSKAFLLTRRMTTMMCEMWMLQYALEKKQHKLIETLLANRYFRAAFDLLAMRAASGEINVELVQWWEQVQNAKPSKRRTMLDKLAKIAKTAEATVTHT